MMNHGHFLYVAAWMREAQEATKLVENIDSRIKNKDLAEEIMLRDIAQSKLREAPSKPNLYVPSLSHLVLMRVSPSAIFL